MPAWLSDYPYVKGDGLFSYEVVGESHYQPELESIVGGRRDASIYFRVVAVLAPEPGNIHDPNAIAVRIGGDRVGYINRFDNLDLREALKSLGVSGDVQCKAEIAGGKAGNFGVKLDLVFPMQVRAPTSLGA